MKDIALPISRDYATKVTVVLCEDTQDQGELEVIYRDGKFLKETSFQEILDRVNTEELL